MNLYFNEHEFKKAIDTIESNPRMAINLLYEYIRKYPEDFCGYSYLSAALINVGRVEEADTILENSFAKLKQYDKLNETKRDLFDNFYYKSKIKILTYKEKYEEAMNYLLFNIDKLNPSDIGRLRFYLSVKTGRVEYYDIEPTSYQYLQIKSYSEEEFFNHIKKHLLKYNLDSDMNLETLFNLEFPEEKIIEEIKKYIPSDKKIFSDFVDKYTFKYDFCGRANNKVSDFFRVVTFHNENKLLTMYPISYGSELDYVDLNYLKEEKNVRRLSRIDKFNQKYSAK